MRHSIAFCGLLLLSGSASIIGCRTVKESASNSSAEVDSLVRSVHHRTIMTIDSLLQRLDFRFDSLSIRVLRPVADAEVPEVIELTATNGNIHSDREQHRNQLEEYNRQDSVAFHQTSNEQHTVNTSLTRVASPPDGTKILAVIVVAAIILWYICKRS